MRCSFNLTKILQLSGYDSLLFFRNINIKDIQSNFKKI